MTSKYFLDLSIEDFIQLADVIANSWFSFGNHFPEAESSMTKIENTPVDAREKVVMILCVLRDHQTPIPISRLISYLKRESELLKRDASATSAPPLVTAEVQSKVMNSSLENPGN